MRRRHQSATYLVTIEGAFPESSTVEQQARSSRFLGRDLAAIIRSAGAESGAIDIADVVAVEHVSYTYRET